MAEDQKEIETLNSRLVYQNRWMKVREDAIRRNDGSTGIYGVVEKPDFVVIVPREADGSIHLVEQYRYPVGDRFWELPQGAWEDSPKADPLDVATGELKEETGLAAARMTYFGHLFPGYGYATQRCHIFLAQELRHVGADLDHEEQGLITQRFSPSTVAGMMSEGRIRDAITIAALGLVRLKESAAL